MTALTWLCAALLRISASTLPSPTPRSPPLLPHLRRPSAGARAPIPRSEPAHHALIVWPDARRSHPITLPPLGSARSAPLGDSLSPHPLPTTSPTGRNPSYNDLAKSIPTELGKLTALIVMCAALLRISASIPYSPRRPRYSHRVAGRAPIAPDQAIASRWQPRLRALRSATHSPLTPLRTTSRPRQGSQ